MNREEKIRARAHAIWESEGQPSGCDQDHWARASQEIDGQDAPEADDAPRVSETGTAETGTVAPAETDTPALKKAPAKRAAKAKQPSQPAARATKGRQSKSTA